MNIDDEEQQFVARAREQADIFEAIKRQDGPGSQVQREGFSALVVDARVASLDDVLAALIDWSRPFLAYSQLPDEMFAWAARAGDFHVVFYGSSPSPAAWIGAEHMMEPFGALPSYFHVEHDEKDVRFDRLVELDGERLRLMSVEHSDYDRAPVVGSGRVERDDPWRLLEERTGVSLRELRRAIEGGAPTWLICRGVIVLPGVARNRVPVRRKVREAPPSQPMSFDDVIAAAEKEWVAVFEGSVFRHARVLAEPAHADRLIDVLTSKGPRPRTSRIALAAIGMLRVDRAAPHLVAWTNKGSEALRRAAVGALAMLGEGARQALMAGAASRKTMEKKACNALLNVLDAPAYQGLRDVRAARSHVNDEAALRLTHPDLVAIHAQDLDMKARVEERETILREGGAGLAARHLGWMLEHVDPSVTIGMRMSNEGVLALITQDPLAPWVLPCLLLEHPIGDTHLSGYASRKGMIAAAMKLFGKPFRAALSAVERVTSPK